MFPALDRYLTIYQSLYLSPLFASALGLSLLVLRAWSLATPKHKQYQYIAQGLTTPEHWSFEPDIASR